MYGLSAQQMWLKMRIEKKEQKTIEIIKTLDIVCNKCGKSLRIDDYNCFAGGAVKVDFGYGSVNDGEIKKFEICDDCYNELISTFKHSPEGEYDDTNIAKYFVKDKDE